MKRHRTRRLVGLATLGPLPASSAVAQDPDCYGGAPGDESGGSFDGQCITNSVIGGGLGHHRHRRKFKDGADLPPMGRVRAVDIEITAMR